MEQSEILLQISDLEREIAALPPGSLSVKRVKGKEYYYHRYTVDGKRSENYVDFNHVEELRAQIEKRKTLEAELKKLKQSVVATKPKAKPQKKTTHEFRTDILTCLASP